MKEQGIGKIWWSAFVFSFALMSILLSNQTADADEVTGEVETSRPAVSLNTDLALPLFGLHYVDLEFPLSERIDLTIGFVYQELPKWVLPDWAENRGVFGKLGTLYFFSEQRRGWLLYLDSFVGWNRVKNYKDSMAGSYDGMEYLGQLLVGYRFPVCGRVSITPCLGMLYGHSEPLSDADKEIDDDIAYQEVGPTLEVTLAFGI